MKIYGPSYFQFHTLRDTMPRIVVRIININAPKRCREHTRYFYKVFLPTVFCLSTFLLLSFYLPSIVFLPTYLLFLAFYLAALLIFELTLM